MNAHVTPQGTAAGTTGNLDSLDFWSKRYYEEGHIWGDEASLTAQKLAAQLSEDASVRRVLEVGFGYGRDLKEFLQHGYDVVGLEMATVGLNMAARELLPYVDTGRATLIWGEFSASGSIAGKFDAVSSHRVLHLLGNNGKVRAFANKAANVLDPGGLLYVSARSPKDFNQKQMAWVGDKSDNLAVYKDRPGHLISFWDEARFRDTFGKKFDMIEFVEGTEIESMNNPVPSHFLMMQARRKVDPEPSLS